MCDLMWSDPQMLVSLSHCNFLVFNSCMECYNTLAAWTISQQARCGNTVWPKHHRGILLTKSFRYIQSCTCITYTYCLCLSSCSYLLWCQSRGSVFVYFFPISSPELVIRSHEVKHEGYEVAHNGKCITVFSAPNYWCARVTYGLRITSVFRHCVSYCLVVIKWAIRAHSSRWLRICSHSSRLMKQW